MHVCLRILHVLCIGAALVVPGTQQDRVPPRWLDAEERPNASAREALAVLGESGSHGLDPALYALSRDALSGGPRFEQELTRALSQYLLDLHRGRIDPQTLGLHIERRPASPDMSLMLRQAVDAGRLRAFISELAPRTKQYQSLQATLARYRELARGASLPDIAPGGGAIHPGDSFSGAAALHARLVAFGDIAAGTPPAAGEILAGALVEGLKRFQDRHGLASDGILGRQTIAALQVSPALRVRQIELALERLRWLPRDAPERMIIVNIPMFRLWALEREADAADPLTMKVIVGRALRTRTPVFTANLEAVVFRPYWNVPPSIARGEIVPKARRDPNYLARNHFDIVRGDGDDAVIVQATAAVLDQVARGTLRIRQRPGPDNALGLIKFDIPNVFAVYMHGTPSVQLFSEERRDFSHGCVRVEDPVALARWALDTPEWSLEAVRTLANGDRSQRVAVARSIKVWLFYNTVVAMPDGTTHFAADVYGHDARLDRALSGN
jgi:murein L,D-transpeptidase YcbB/YkuD